MIFPKICAQMSFTRKSSPFQSPVMTIYETMRIYGHLPVIDGSKTTYRRRLLRKYDPNFELEIPKKTWKRNVALRAEK